MGQIGSIGLLKCVLEPMNLEANYNLISLILSF
jgi:hypothetical protein